MARSDERKFITFERGKVRDEILLTRWRNVLRTQTNPDTNRPFTESEIALITQPGSRFYIEADAIDLLGQAIQSRALWFSDQVVPNRASSEMLKELHGALWAPEGKLTASGGGGKITGTGASGTTYVGSTTLGDATAAVARDSTGFRYQVLSTANILPGTNSVELELAGIDTGTKTNPAAGSKLTWINPPIGSDPTALIGANNFRGGFDEETDSQYALRIERRIRYKPGAGNNAQFREWATRSTSAVEDAFIYACALHSGSTLITVLQKRGDTVGPLARIASFSTLTLATAFLTPPASPVVPERVFTLVTTAVSQPVNVALKLEMPRGSNSGGWKDVDPWPKFSPAFPQGVLVTGIVSSTVFEVTTDQRITGSTVAVPIPGNVAPRLMMWNQLTSKFVSLDVASIVNTSGNIWRITLGSPPSFTIATGDVLSPLNARAGVISNAIESYFDELGPGEIVGGLDVRFFRAARFPSPQLEYSFRVGQSMITRLAEQLGGALNEAELSYISATTPTVPTTSNIANGPALLTVNRVGVYVYE